MLSRHSMRYSTWFQARCHQIEDGSIVKVLKFKSVLFDILEKTSARHTHIASSNKSH